MTGSFTFVLHSHLPYVLRHGKWPHGSDWLSEAVAECYIPILGILKQLEAKNIRSRISMDFTPILLEQLAADDFPEIFVAYCDEKIDLAEKDYDYFFRNNEPELRPLALFWHGFYSECKRAFIQDYHEDLISAFRHFEENGTLDAMTSGATHGYFPLLLHDENIKAQIALGIRTHEKYFGMKPRGIWLPECGYRPRYDWSPSLGPDESRSFHAEREGIEEILSEFGLEYFVAEGSLTRGGTPLGSYFQLFQPIHPAIEREDEWKKLEFHFATHGERSLSDIYAVKSTYRDLAGKPPVVFSRDRKTSEQVWSGEIGYPGEPRYLEFHKKHHNSGLRYWSVTDAKADLGSKQVYDPALIGEQVEMHARHFVALVKDTLRDHKERKGSNGIVCSPFDTELFGHWWFEGPRFIGKVFELLERDPDIRLTNCSEYLDERKEPVQVIALPEGSWGEGGGHYVWSNHNVAWTWDHIYPAEARFGELVKKFNQGKKTDFLERVIRQTTRELLLLESSDWQFIITTGGAPEYAKERFNEHVRQFNLLADLAERTMNRVTPDEHDKELLENLEKVDAVFVEIDLGWWSS